MLDIAIILVDPARPGNIGAAARAMKTMGFLDLRIVASAPERAKLHESDEARAFAHGSGEILDAVTCFQSLENALRDRDLVIGTTARRRGKRDDYYTPPQIREMLHGGERGERIALVFGREESGLSNEELDQCHITTAIPMRSSYPSLNLAQAVMVYCYELAPLRFEIALPEQKETEEATMRVLHDRTADTLLKLGFDPGRALYRRILERVGAVRRGDAHLILSVIKALDSIGQEPGTRPARER